MDHPSILTSETVPQEARFSTEQYYRISESGALDGFAKTELHDGRIVVVNAQHVPHSRAKTLIAFELRDSLHLGDLGLSVIVEADVEIAAGEVLQPDVTVWEETPELKGIPGDQVRLVVEIADSSEHVDLRWKRGRYAEARIPEYWVAVLRTERFERFADPADGEYRRHDSFAFAEGCTSLSLPGISVRAGLIRT